MSTGRTGTINQALGIALIVFVMLTFILTVTTYLFFGQKMQAEQLLAEQVSKADEATDAAGKETDRFKALAEIAGLPADKSAEDLKAELEASCPDYDEQASGPLTAVNIAKWLDKARLKKDEDLKAAEAARAASEETAKKSEQALDEAKRQFETRVKEMEAAVADEKAKADRRRGEFEETEKALVAEKQRVLEQVEGLKLLSEQIALGEGLVGEKAFDGKDDKKRVGLLLKAIRDRNKTIELLERSEILRTVAAVDPKVQVYVLEALGATASEIEALKPIVRRPGFAEQEAAPIDGRIVSVDERERSVTIACDSTFGVRPGLVFNVHSEALPAGSSRPVKAVVEVVQVDGPSLIRGRIRRDAIRDPILAGDTVSTPLWSPLKPIEAVVVGFVDLDGDGKEEMNALEGLIRRGGGTVVPGVGNSTTVLVDAGRPAPAAEGGPTRATLRPAEDKRRTAQLAEARSLGIRVLTLDAFLDWLGAGRPESDREAVAVPGTSRVPPTRELSY